MEKFLENKLYADVEGTCSGAYGYIIAVLSIVDIGQGNVLSGTGQAEFITVYRAIVFKPFKGEVVDGIVGEVNKVSILPAAAFPGPKLTRLLFQMGFFVEVGPLNVFVSNHVGSSCARFEEVISQTILSLFTRS